MPIAEVSAIITSIKATIEIAKGLKSSYDAHTIAQAQSDILEQLLAIRMDTLTLQEKHSTLINEKDELAKKLVQLEQWEKTESEYELQEINRGKFVYSPKNSQQSKKPTHWLCTQCWDDRKKSVLQANYHTESEAQYICPRCKLRFDFYFSGNSP
jgi:transcriptional regulator with GAF, ATPase, and Fis domain